MPEREIFSLTIGSGDRRQYLKPIPKGIEDIETIKSGQRPIGFDHHARLLESPPQCSQVVHQ